MQLALVDAELRRKDEALVEAGEDRFIVLERIGFVAEARLAASGARRLEVVELIEEAEPANSAPSWIAHSRASRSRETS